MYFDINSYKNSMFYIPIGFIFVLIFVPQIRCALYIYKEKVVQSHGLSKTKWFISFVFAIVVQLYFVWSKLCYLVYGGGGDVAYENESDAVRMEGTISEIVELDFFQFCRFHGNGEKASGFEFYINEIKCTDPIRDELQVGDYVEVEYLPKSGYVLYINKVPER